LNDGKPVECAITLPVYYAPERRIRYSRRNHDCSAFG
jgi:hypothetical protein